MRHAPYWLDLCKRPWCLRRRAALSIRPVCEQHGRLTPNQRKAMVELLAKCKPIEVDTSWRPA